jgi:bifunctional non-homologous end joining protein LigD
VKFDGFRLLIARDGDQVVLRYRTGRDVTSQYPELVEAARALPGGALLLDGELVVFGRDGRSDFDLLRARAQRARRWGMAGGGAAACVFDVLSLEGRDVRGLPLRSRKGLLKGVLADAGEPLVYVEHVEEDGERAFRGARRLGLEGLVAKKASAPYPRGRSDSWVKLKIEDTGDFAIVGIAAPSRETFDRPGLVLARVTPRGVRYAGRVAVGATELRVLEGLRGQLERRRSACRAPVRAEVWLEPAVVCEVRFLASGRGLRHAVFVRFRPDLSGRACLRSSESTS